MLCLRLSLNEKSSPDILHRWVLFSQVETRGKYNLWTPKVVTERSRFCLRYLIPLHWERLKNEIDFNVSIDAIRRKLKRVLIESYKSK